MLGPLLAMLSAAFFALQAVASRRGLIRVADTSPGVFVTVFLAPPLLALALLSVGQLDRVGSFPWQGYLLLVGAGIVHFVIGRSLNFATVQLLGANRASICVGTSTLYSVTSGIVLFRETLSWQVASGAGLVILGIVLIALGVPKVNPEYRPHFGSTVKGVLLGLGAGLFYGMSPVMVKAALGTDGSALAATFISYLGASAVLGLTLSNRSKRVGLRGIERQAFWWFCATGVFLIVAHLLRYSALTLAPLSIVAPLSSITPLLVVGFSFVLNRREESFNPRVIYGAGAIVAGTVILL